MTEQGDDVVGIDVGGTRKGFHAVALRGGVFEMVPYSDSANIASWCRDQNIAVVAVDAPCKWSTGSRSRLAERMLKLNGVKVPCFSTPTEAVAIAHTKGFYGWTWNGMVLYEHLAPTFPLFDGTEHRAGVSLETFPHAIVCALVGKVVPARPKLTSRREVLRTWAARQGWTLDVRQVPNIDFVDAALCAVTALEFSRGRFTQFGGAEEGFIVVPSIDGGLRLPHG